MNVAYCLVGEIIINQKNYTEKCKITTVVGGTASGARREDTNRSMRNTIR